MFVKQQKRKDGRVYLSIAHGYRENGKTKTKHVKSLGYLDELEKLYDDPVAHFKAEIERENEAARSQTAPITVSLSPFKKIDKRVEGCLDVGAAIPSAYFHRDLGIWDFFERRRTARNFSYDPCRILELLVWDRIANPGSKASAFAQKERFPRKCDFSRDDVYHSLDYLADKADELIKHINASIENVRGPRDKTQLYYDVINYYFETDGEDEDGLEKKRASKEHRSEAIMQMGLLLDADGIPLDYKLFPGSDNDISTMLPTMEKAGLRSADDPEGERVVVVADKGLNTSANIAACTLNGGGFVFSQSVRRASKQLKTWVLDEGGYVTSASGRFKIKSHIVDKVLYVEDEDGQLKKVTVPVKEVAFWSRDFFERIRHERAKVLENTKTAPVRGDASAIVARSSAEYAKDAPIVKATEEKAEHDWVLDENKFELDTAMDGYYCIITSEHKWSELEVIEAYRGLSRIEESFRVLKSTIDAHPVYMWTKKHLEAHFLICYVALMIMRLMQADVEVHTGTRPSADAVAGALRKMVGHRLDENVYHFDYRTNLTDALCEAVGIDLSYEVMTKAQINKVMSAVKKPKT